LAFLTNRDIPKEKPRNRYFIKIFHKETKLWNGTKTNQNSLTHPSSFLPLTTQLKNQLSSTQLNSVVLSKTKLKQAILKQ
jgi:hypothetical protein